MGSGNGKVAYIRNGKVRNGEEESDERNIGKRQIGKWPGRTSDGSHYGCHRVVALRVTALLQQDRPNRLRVPSPRFSRRAVRLALARAGHGVRCEEKGAAAA